MQPAAPDYQIGERVLYQDHHGRLQTGEVMRVEASWSGGRENPFIQYVLSHPTYRNRKHYTGAEHIFGFPNS